MFGFRFRISGLFDSERYEAAFSSLRNLKDFGVYSFSFRSVQNCVRAASLVFANPQNTLEKFALSLPVVKRDMALLVAPSLHNVQSLRVYVGKGGM